MAKKKVSKKKKAKRAAPVKKASTRGSATVRREAAQAGKDLMAAIAKKTKPKKARGKRKAAKVKRKAAKKKPTATSAGHGAGKKKKKRRLPANVVFLNFKVLKDDLAKAKASAKKFTDGNMSAWVRESITRYKPARKAA